VKQAAIAKERRAAGGAAALYFAAALLFAATAVIEALPWQVALPVAGLNGWAASVFFGAFVAFGYCERGTPG
jgi:hypothetical protein